MGDGADRAPGKLADLEDDQSMYYETSDEDWESVGSWRTGSGNMEEQSSEE